MDKSQLVSFLYRVGESNRDLLFYILEEYVNTLEAMGDSKLDELEDFLVNNFSDD